MAHTFNALSVKIQFSFQFWTVIFHFFYTRNKENYKKKCTQTYKNNWQKLKNAICNRTKKLICHTVHIWRVQFGCCFFFFGTPIQTKRRRNEKHTRQSKKFHRIQYVRAQNSSRNETSEEEKMESKMERYNCKIERRTISDPCNNEARKHFFFFIKPKKRFFSLSLSSLSTL